MAPSHYLNQFWNDILMEIHTFSFKEMPLENVVCEVASILSRPQCVNSWCPCDAIWHQIVWSPWDQAMAKDLWHQAICSTNDDLLSIGPWVQSMKFSSELKNLCLRKCIWKFHLRNGGRFVQGSMYKLIEAEWRIYVRVNQPIIGSDNGLSPSQRQAIIWTNAGILLIRTFGTNFSEILSEIHTFSFKKIHLQISFAKWQPFCLSLSVLIFTPSKRLILLLE